MTVLVKKYPVFEDNQVLTSSQLNNLVEYLDQQNRLTRVSLIGVGILCGLELSCQPPATAGEGERIITSGGVGVTSEGYLIKMKECVNTKRRTYTLPENVEYPPFMNPDTDEQDVTLFEMLTASADFDEQNDIVPLVKEEVQDMVVMLFVECLDKDLKSCLGKSCDQLGIDRFLNIRKLLVSRADYEKIKARTEGGYQDVQFPDRFLLPKVVVPRTMFFPEIPQSEYYFQYSTHFLPNIFPPGTNLIAALKKSYTIYEPILESIYGTNPFETTEVNNILLEWISYLFGADGSPIPFLGMQYFYDFIKDLAQAYCEFRESACLLTSLCCPAMDRFPKHLTLGVIDKDAEGKVTREFRHQFTQPPVYGNQKDLTSRVIQLHQKCVALIESFDLLRLLTSNNDDFRIKVTPSCEKKSLLSERSIPFYYNLSRGSNFEKLRPIEEIWTASIKSKFGRAVLSYDKHFPMKPDKDPVATPLDFDLDPYNFLRIAGHVGKDVSKAMSQIENIRNTKNLSFDVKAVYLGKRGLAMEIPECLCTDLQVDYGIWRTKTIYFLKSLLALTTRLGNAYNKRDNLGRSVLPDFRADDATFTRKDTSDKASTFFEKDSRVPFSTIRPIKINPAKINDFSDIKLDVTKDNWHLAGKQIIDAVDKFKVAEKLPNDDRDFDGLGDKNPIKYFFDDFNNCLCNLIDSMKLDVKDFDLEEWKKHYACMFQTNIRLMKNLISKLDNAKASSQVYVFLSFYCAVHKALRFLAIYPYITIGHISQILNFRKNNFLESFKLSNFLKKHPGAEHKAGVAPGDTFLLLYIADDAFLLDTTNPGSDGSLVREKGKLNSLFDLKNVAIPDKGFINKEFQERLSDLKDFKNKVVGDFTLPYSCCDDCPETPDKPMSLDPLGLPVCGVVITDPKDNNEMRLPYFGDYKPVEIKMISYIYEREPFQTRLTSNARFGTVEFNMVNSDFEYDIKDNEKEELRKVEVMSYTVIAEKVDDEYKKYPDVGMLVDQFDYEYYKPGIPSEVICKSTVTIFIPVIPRIIDDSKTGLLTGKVFLNRGPLKNAVVEIKDTDFKIQKTKEDGSFEFRDVPFGDLTLRVTHQTIQAHEEPAFFQPTGQDVGIITTRVKIRIKPPSVALGKIFTELKISNDSVEALNVVNFYTSNTTRYKSNMETLAKVCESPAQPVLKATSKLVQEISDKKDLKVAKLNTQFSTAVTNIDKRLSRASEGDKTALREAMKNLVPAYLQRLSVEEPNELSDTTIKTMARTSAILKKVKYPELRVTVNKWLDSSDGNVSEAFVKNVKSKFRLR